MMRSLAAAAALVPVSVPAKEPVSVEDCRANAITLADMLASVFGGQWKVSLQPDFLMISKKVL